ncbi:MAG: hypothetical protein U0797_31700 [Gemmataceae bacterium]
MYLRSTKRIKDGKEHRYWSIVESKRCAGGRVVQRPVLYLGEINDSQRAAWCRVIEGFDEHSRGPRQMALFPADRTVPDHARADGIQVQLSAMQLLRPRLEANGLLGEDPRFPDLFRTTRLGKATDCLTRCNYWSG